MPYCDKKGLYCSQVGNCEQVTDSCSLPDWIEKEIVFTEEDLKRMYEESSKEKEIESFDSLLTELTESGIKLIKDYHAATKRCEDMQQEIHYLRVELDAIRSLLESFEQGNIIAPVLQDKIIDYLVDLSKKPGSKKTAIDKAIKWAKNNFKN